MRWDLYIGRGSRQRSLKKSLWCNPFKVSEHGRDIAVSMFEDHLRTDQDLNDALWQVSGARLVCHCRPGESCHADVIRRIFSERFPEAHDRDTEQAEPPTAQVLNYMAKLRSDGSSADEGAPERGAGWVGHRPPIEVGVGYVSRELCHKCTQHEATHSFIHSFIHSSDSLRTPRHVQAQRESRDTAQHLRNLPSPCSSVVASAPVTYVVPARHGRFLTCRLRTCRGRIDFEVSFLLLSLRVHCALSAGVCM